MTEFDYFFTLFGLLLGFSLVEVIGGLAKTIEARMRPGASLRIGLLTPLLGLFVMLDLISFWSAAWLARDLIHITFATLIGGMLFAGAYYLAAHLVFPSHLEGIDDLDAHYGRVKLPVLGGLFALMLLQLGYWLSVPQLARGFQNAFVLWHLGIFIVLFLATILVRGRVWNGVMLAILSLRYLYLATL